MKKVGIPAFALVATFALMQSSDAEASARRVPASICFPDTDYFGDFVFDQGIANQSGGLLGRQRWLHCPVLDDDVFIPGVGNPLKKVKTNSVWIDGFDGNNDADGWGDVYVRLCHSAWTSSVPVCTSWIRVTQGARTGSYSTFFGRGHELVEALRNPTLEHWFPDLQIALPKQGVLGKSSFYGYVIRSDEP